MPQPSTLSSALSSGALLTGSTRSTAPADLKDVLRTRLDQYYIQIGSKHELTDKDRSLEDVEMETAREALNIVETVHKLLVQAPGASSPQDSVQSHSAEDQNLGARDLVHLRILLSLAFKWGVLRLLERVTSAWTIKPSRLEPKIIDLTDLPQDYSLLSSFITRILAFVLPDGAQGIFLRSSVSSIVLIENLPDLLASSITLGWLPRSLSSPSTPTLDSVRPIVMRLLASVQPSAAIASLGAVLSSNSASLLHVRKSCNTLLSKQLLRRDGIRGLFMALFDEGESSADDTPLEKLEHVARALNTVPPGVRPEEYYRIVVPGVLFFLTPDSEPVSSSYIRAAAFSLSRMLVIDQNPHRPDIKNALLPVLHNPFMPQDATPPEKRPPLNSNTSTCMATAAALSTLIKLITNTDPDPRAISAFLSPVLPSLYAIWADMEHKKTFDPSVKESVRGLLLTWGRIVNPTEGIVILWKIIDGEGGKWDVDIAGEIKEVGSRDQMPSLALFTPESLQEAEQSGDLDVDANIFDLRPDPVKFVRFLKSVDRLDMSSDVFMKLLDRYQELRSDPEADPRRNLLYLQLVLQMQSQLASNDSSDLLKKPEHALSFVKHALETASAALRQTQAPRSRATESLRVEDLRIVADDPENDIDSDDEDTPEAGGDEEMTVTATTLLLSLLEANEDLSVRTSPILNDIYTLLDPLGRVAPDPVRRLAKEARLVITARLALTSARHARSSASKNREDEDAQATYQRALKLLQDPILPVRAHGLLLLRELITRKSGKSGAQLVNPALIPAILDIFLQSIQDDESYIFLNAVQGLSAMVDGFGKDVLKGLVKLYAQGLQGAVGSDLTQQDVDTRLRIGEALEQVIKRCGDALVDYASIMVPSLFQVVRSAFLAASLRTSAVSLLGECARTNSLALLPYTSDLTSAMIDLLQIESKPTLPNPRTEATPDGDEREEQAVSMDTHPTSTYSKLPPLRRAALHFLSLLLRSCISSVYESGSHGIALPLALLSRLKITLGYVAATDEDSVVRVMARETLDDARGLEEAVSGM